MKHFGFAAIIMWCVFSWKPLKAQYPDVHEEPFHVPVYEWDCLRFLSVRANPGDTTAYHVHRNPIVYLTIQGTEVWLDDVGSDPRTASLPDAWVGSDLYGPGDTLLHRFAVSGESSLKIVAVERLGDCAVTYDKPTGEPFYKENGFSVYAVDWDTYVNRQYYSKFPAVVPPEPIFREGWVKYGSGHILRPGEEGSGTVHAPGVEVLWMVVPSD